MAYGDGLFVIGAEGTPVNADAVAGDNWTFRSPYALMVEQFGLLITEVGAAAVTDAVESLDWLDKDTARTEILTLSLDATLYSRGDGKKISVTPLTADTELAVGDIVYFSGKTLPFRLPAGGTLISEHKTQGNGATLAYVPVAMVRVDGYSLEAKRALTLDAAR